jgi:hypothetical protein
MRLSILEIATLRSFAENSLFLTTLGIHWITGIVVSECVVQSVTRLQK